MGVSAPARARPGTAHPAAVAQASLLPAIAGATGWQMTGRPLRATHGDTPKTLCRQTGLRPGPPLTICPSGPSSSPRPNPPGVALCLLPPSSLHRPPPALTVGSHLQAWLVLRRETWALRGLQPWGGNSVSPCLLLRGGHAFIAPFMTPAALGRDQARASGGRAGTCETRYMCRRQQYYLGAGQPRTG
jgi:hypothetical protein